MRLTPIRRVPAAWRELGRIGRVAVVGIIASGGVAVALGIAIPRVLENHLLDERATTLERIVDDMVAGEVITDPMDDFTRLDEFVRLRVIGGDTVRVKLWSPDGEILWSDEPRLMGRRFNLGGNAVRALGGEASSHVSSLSKPEHVFELGFGRLLEFYVPVRIGDSIPLIFEVYQRVDPLTTTVARARRTVWLSISLGLGTMGIFIVAIAGAVVASADRRRRQAESVLERLAAVRDEERARLANAMHDDMGQPLYRLLYGLESLRGGDADTAELERLRSIAREIDDTLRGELRRLQEPALAGRSISEVITEMEDLHPQDPPSIRVSVAEVEPVSAESAEVLYRAVREAVNNARRHAEAGTIHVSLTRDGDRLTARVADDGHGVRGDPGLGTMLMTRLLAAVDGRVETRSRPGRGTTVTISVPSGRGT